MASELDSMQHFLKILPNVARDGALAAPNATLRCALFAGANATSRRGLRRETLASLSNFRLIYTGLRLDQGDLDCWLAVLQAAHESPTNPDGRFCVSGRRLLRLMGLKNTGPNQDLLDGRLSKLKSGAIDLKGDRYSYEGSLIDEVFRDSVTRHVVIKLNPRMAILFGGESGWTKLSLDVRSRLGRNALAKWLYAYLASHRVPTPIGVSLLKELSSSEYAELWRFRQHLRKALNALNHVTSWELNIDDSDCLVGRPIQRSQLASATGVGRHRKLPSP